MMIHTHDNIYWNKTEIQNRYYNKIDSDNRYSLATHTHLPGDADTLDGLDSTAFAMAAHTHDDIYWNKTAIASLFYNRSESDARYSQLGHLHSSTYYNKTESDSRYASIAHIHDASEITTGTLDPARLPSSINVPIGSIIAWNKNMAGTPALLDGFVECNGSVINDAASPYNGLNTPNLNGENRFLRGDSTSGDVGGNDVLSLAQRDFDYTTFGSHALGINTIDGIRNGNIDNKPPYYEVVWVMRIK